MPEILGALRSRSALLALGVIAVVTTMVVLPGYFQLVNASQVRIRRDKASTAIKLEKMYDIREDRKNDAPGKLEGFRASAGKDAAEVADIRDGFVRGEEKLKQNIPNVQIEYNNDIRTPEVISSRMDTHFEPLTPRSKGSREIKLRDFLRSNNLLVGVENDDVDELKVTADYTNPAGNISYVTLEQEFNGVPVFRGEVKAGFRKDGSMIRIINNLAPGIDAAGLSLDFGDPTQALDIAARHVGYVLDDEDMKPDDGRSTDLKVNYGKGDWAPTAEKSYFPTEPGVAIPAWRILMWRGDAYYVIVDANTGTVLWHKNITDEQTQSATFQIYGGLSSYLDVADSPAPLSPYVSGLNIDPAVSAQGAVLTRSNRSLIGNESGLSFNNNGWITDGTNITDGNATEAGVDRDTTDGVDATQSGDTACPGAGCRVFTSTWNPPPGNPPPGDDPLSAQAQRGAVIQMFYIMNRYHDELYSLGFNEQARNFQQSNFNRGGAGSDRISSQGQDNTAIPGVCTTPPCFNNANFTTPADGGRGRMQMYIFNGPTPDRDGTTDADIIIHEATHGTSNRLIGNASALGAQGGMMGEGWGDFYAQTLLAESTDPINGVYGIGGYTSLQIDPGFTSNYYYGIRRFPSAVMAFTGGPQNKPYNPLTFGDINAGCNLSDGAFSPAFSGGCSEVHNAGEIWSSALWEVRALMIQRLGFTAGTRRVLQVVTDGMKLTPLNPTFIQGRDAIIAAATAISAADASDVREGFRIRGMGFSASVQSNTSVTEAFDVPNVKHVDPFSVSDFPGDNDGFPEPNENVLLNIAVSNTIGSPVANVQVNINGGPNFSYGTINDGQTITNQIPYQIPAGAACGSLHQITVNVTSAIGAQVPVVRAFRLGAPVPGSPVTFANNTAMTIQDAGPSSVYPSSVSVSGLTGNKLITVNLLGLTHTFPGDLDMLLVGPGGQKFIFASDSGDTGNVSSLNISFADAASAQPSSTQWVTGTFKPVNSGANDAFVGPAPAGPYSNAAPAGSDTFGSVFGTNSANLNGTWSLYIVDDATDDVGSLAGWSLTFDPFDFACTQNVSVRGRVIDTNGRGIGKAYVQLTDGVTSQIAITNSFGYFGFPVLVPGVQYTVTPSSKRYTFTPQNTTPMANVTNLNFVGT